MNKEARELIVNKIINHDDTWANVDEILTIIEDQINEARKEKLQDMLANYVMWDCQLTTKPTVTILVFPQLSVCVKEGI